MFDVEVSFRSKVLRLVWIALVSFLALQALAMVLYPDKGGYSFFYEYLSALGMTISHDGADNLVSCLLFNFSLGAGMLLLIPFWYIRAKCIRGGKWLKTAGFIFCTGFSLSIIEVALAPYNLLAHIHNFSTYSAFAFIVPGCLILIMWANSNYCRTSYKLAWLGFAILFLICELIVQVNVVHGVLPSRPTGPIMQKFNIAVFLVWLTVELILYGKYLRTHPEPARVPVEQE